MGVQLMWNEVCSTLYMTISQHMVLLYVFYCVI